MQTTVSLQMLHFGHEATPPINARTFDRDVDLKSLAASIHAHGLIQALNVREIGGSYFVADGNRRLAALQLLAKDGKLPGEGEIKIDVSDDTVAGDEISLAANFERAPMHEADQLVKFSELRRRGASEAEIASRFGIEPARVKRILAIGTLSPVILDAWRSGELGNQASQVVQAFTLAASIKEQEAVFKRLSKSQDVNAWQVKKALGADDTETGRLVGFVGVEAYKAAGGTLVEDLFGQQHRVNDPKLVLKLATTKFKELTTKMLADGWAFAGTKQELGYNWNWSALRASGKAKATAEQQARMDELQKTLDAAEEADDDTPEANAAQAEMDSIEEAVALTAFTEADRKKSGVAYEFSHTGRLNLQYGVQKPGAARAAEKKKAPPKTADGKPAPKAPSILSNAQAHDLSVQLTSAVQEAIGDNPHVGLVALLAGLATSGFGHPVMVKAEGMGASATRKSESFKAAFVRFNALPDGDLVGLAAKAVARAVTLVTHSNGHVPVKDKGNAVLLNALDPTTIQPALLKHFDAKDYFERASKPFVITAISEAVNADEARKADKLKKADLVKMALDCVPKTGWLPPELRTASYAGPTAPKASKAEKPASTKAASAKKKPAPAAKAKPKAAPKKKAA